MKWAPVPNWGDRYEVNECGQVRSKDMLVGAKNNSQALRIGRELTQVRKNNGYLCVTLTKKGYRAQVAIHRIVARVFLGECPLGLHVLHNNGDKTNNHFSNLRYGTPAENVADTLVHGNRRMGATHPLAKLDDEAVQHIRTSSRNGSVLAEMYKVSKSHISAIRRNRVWKHI